MQPAYEYDGVSEIDMETGEIPAATLAPITATEMTVTEAPHMLNPDQIPDLAAMDEGISLKVEYLEFEVPGQTERVVFIGWTKIPSSRGGKIDAAMFQTKVRVFINAGSNLVTQISPVPIGTPVQITYNGKEDTKRGNKVKVFTVRLLNVRKEAPAPERNTTLDASDAEAGFKPSVGAVGAGIPPMNRKAKQPA